MATAAHRQKTSGIYWGMNPGEQAEFLPLYLSLLWAVCPWDRLGEAETETVITCTLLQSPTLPVASPGQGVTQILHPLALGFMEARGGRDPWTGLR